MAKKFGEYTVHDVYRLKGSFLARDNGEEGTTEQKEADYIDQIAAVSYIVRMAAVYEAQVSNMIVLDVFGDTTRKNRIITDKPTINTMLLAIAEAQEATRVDGVANSIPVQRLNYDLIASHELKSIFEVDYEAQIAAKNSKSSKLADTIVEYNRTILDKYACIRKYEEEIAELEALANVAGDNNQLLNVVTELEKGGIWSYLYTHNGYMYFLANNNCHLSHKNLAAGVDLNICMGQFVARIALDNFRIALHHYDNYKISAGYPHPHVTGSGDICWGDGSKRVSTASANKDIGTILEMAWSLLNQYSDSNPYRGLYNWEKKRAVTSKGNGHLDYSRIDAALSFNAEEKEAELKMLVEYESFINSLETYKMYEMDVPPVRDDTNFRYCLYTSIEGNTVKCRYYSTLNRHSGYVINIHYASTMTTKSKLTVMSSKLLPETLEFEDVKIQRNKRYKLHYFDADYGGTGVGGCTRILSGNGSGTVREFVVDGYEKIDNSSYPNCLRLEELFLRTGQNDSSRYSSPAYNVLYQISDPLTEEVVWQSKDYLEALAAQPTSTED